MHDPMCVKSSSLAILLAMITALAISGKHESSASGSSETMQGTCCPGNSTHDSDTSHAAKAVRLSSRQLLKLVAEKASMAPPGMLDPRTSHLRGKVTVEICIDQNGTVIEVRVIKGHPLAMASAIESVRRWTFMPYRIHGEAKCAVGRLTLKYDFRSDIKGKEKT